jgi:anti-sigma factor RsiW
VSHLDEQLTAFVDGELGDAERERVLAHLAACAECRAEADMLRDLKGRLGALTDGDPSSGLLDRLHALAEETGDQAPPPSRSLPARYQRSRSRPPRVRVRPGGRLRRPSRRGPAGPALERPPARAAGRSGPTAQNTRVTMGAAAVGAMPDFAAIVAGADDGRTSRPRLLRPRNMVAGAVSLAVLGLGAASLVTGAGSGRLPEIAPAVERFVIEHALVTEGSPHPAASPSARR